jgi:flagellar hook-associated protein 2
VYSFYVEQLATAHQIAFEDLPAVPVASGGPLIVQLGDGSAFTVDLVAADADGDGVISQAEIARAINQAENNAGKVTASIVTVGSQTTLILSAAETGADSSITLDVSGLPSGELRNALEGGRELVPAQDAVVWLGGQGGIELRQASNTFTAIEGVSVTFTRAMNPGDAPVTLTVAADDAGTAEAVRSFVNAWNALENELDKLTKSGGESGERGVFASDAGVRTLRSRLNQIIRQEYDGVSLMQLGVRAERDGSLSLDEERLREKLRENPQALETVFGSARLTQRSGMLGALDEYVEQWVKSGSGQIAARQSSLDAIQKRLTERQHRLDQLYDTYYLVFLQQFS